MDEIEIFDNNGQETYRSIRNSVIAAQGKVYAAVNSAMVNAYWEIGEQIYRACGENDRAEYGKNLLRYLSERLTAEFGKGFDESNLRRMRQFYLTFPIRDTLCHELSWSQSQIRPPVIFIPKNVQNQRGASGSLKDKYIRCIIRGCLQAVIKKALPQKSRQQSLNRNMKKPSKTLM